LAAVRSLAGASESMGLYYRREIYWDPQCNVDRNEIHDNVDPVSLMF
jgi:hypothetical protein